MSLPTMCGRPISTSIAKTSPAEKVGEVGKLHTYGGQAAEAVGARERRGERDARDADEHQAELQQVRADDRVLAAERGVGHEDGRREDDRARGREAEGRGQDHLRRLGQQREPDDLGHEHERAGHVARAGAVIAPEDLRQGHGALAADPAREEEAEQQQAEGAREIEPEPRDPVRVDEGREGDRRRSPRRQRGEAEEAPEGVEGAVGDEERRFVAPGAPAIDRADRQDRDEIEREGGEGQRGHGRIMPLRGSRRG